MRQQPDFKESTIVCAMWLIVYRPVEFPDWRDHHACGAQIEKIARERIAENIERRKRDRNFPTNTSFPRGQSTPQDQASIHSESSPLSNLSTGAR